MKDDTTVLFDGASEYSHYKIVDMEYDGRDARVLFGDNNSPQSGAARDDEPELLFEYNQRFLEIAESIRPKNVLVIGGGAFMLPKALLERFDDINIDVVELDPLLVQLSQKFFDLPDDSRLHVYIGDGRAFIDTCVQQYDFIVIDAFSEFNIPRPLLTKQAASRYAHLLTSDGIAAVNFVATYHTHRETLAHNLQVTFAENFVSVEIYPAEIHHLQNGEQNLVLVASKQSEPPLDYLQAAPVALLHEPQEPALDDLQG